MSNEIDLVDSVLKRLDEKGVLKHLLIVGSWSMYFYKHHFKAPLPPLRTEDIDIDANFLDRLSPPVDLSKILEQLGFELNFQGDESISYIYMEDETRFKIEFLVPEKGRGQVKPKKIKGFGISAPRLRWLDILEEDFLAIDYNGLRINIPHPARFVIHKLIISQVGETRKRNPLKAKKDIIQALSVTMMLFDMKIENEITDWLKDKNRRGLKKRRKYIKDALLQAKKEGWADFTVKELELIFDCNL